MAAAAEAWPVYFYFLLHYSRLFATLLYRADVFPLGRVLPRVWRVLGSADRVRRGSAE